MTHPELYVAYSNRAAAHLALGLFDEALEDAVKCQAMAKAAFARNQAAQAAPAFVKARARAPQAPCGRLLEDWRSRPGRARGLILS